MEEKFAGPSGALRVIFIGFLFLFSCCVLLWFLLSMPVYSIFISSAILGLILSGVYLLACKMAKASGELKGDALQIIIRDDEIESIKYGKSVIVMKADEIKGIKISRARGGMIKFIPRNYHDLASIGKISPEATRQYEKSQKWLGLAVPRLRREEMKRLKFSIEGFKDRNNLN